MVSTPRTALRSWLVIGIVLAAVLAVDAYQARHAPAGGRDREQLLLSVLGRRRQSALVIGSGDAVDAPPDRRVAAVMGQAELDLRETRLRAGEQAQLSIVAVMGVVVVRVPDGWTVDARSMPMMGAIRDRRLRPFDALDVPPSSSGPAPRLILRGAIVMGELIIKS